ncbi:hypothetical protein [Limibacillus sp. MBR-115]|jgi:hypothetical protein|uniref:hypothetical protein n=1 Tax=Limibacillus sp. MBR-115 TaxID=3156465 RepID=UPI0033977E94
MATRDLHSHIKAVQHLAAAAYTTTQTPSSGVDLRGFDSAEFLIGIGAVTSISGSPQSTWTFKLQDSDSESSNFSDVTDSSIVLVGSAKSPVAAPNSSTGVFLTIDADTEDLNTYRVGYVGSKRYVRCVATAANSPGSTPLYVVALLGHAALAPTAD